MLFNSLPFFVFFLVVYFLYLASSHKLQNRLLLFASYFFYGWWDWRFLSLIWISTIVDYWSGLWIQSAASPDKKKLFLTLSVVTNLTILGFFKYYNFFFESAQKLASALSLGSHFGNAALHIVLPVGISFYTFQTMSYTIDVYRGKVSPTRNFFDFALFVAFFPQLVAGPIERAQNLLPQVLAPRRLSWDDFYEGCFLIFWGLYQKVFIADNLARFVDPVFKGAPPYDGLSVTLAVYAFAFQIFCDFAGYSNIARGLGKLMGFHLTVNFNAPYFSSNPREFWARWHISLSSWLRDYLYIPLGGNRKGAFAAFRNLIVTMLLGGLWHGASWTFVLWGAYHGILLAIHRIAEPFLKLISGIKNAAVENIGHAIKVLVFFHLVCLGWLFFRADSVSQAFAMLSAILGTHFLNGAFAAGFADLLLKILPFTLLLLVVEVFQYLRRDVLAVLRFKPAVQIGVYLTVLYSLILAGAQTGEAFIYFQF